VSELATEPCLASQTVGPFFHLGLAPDDRWRHVAGPHTSGERIRLRLTIVDGDGRPIPDGLIEIWQADAQGRYPHPADPLAAEADPTFSGFGRSATNNEGVCEFETIMPGRVRDGRGGAQASHINISLFARGLLARLISRVYFADDPALADDAILALVPESRRSTLIARRDQAMTGQWVHEIRLQGPLETVFFEV